MPPAAVPRRRWFRVSLRGLMILVLLVGGGVGWLAYKIRTQRGAIQAITAAGGAASSFSFDIPRTDDPWTTRLRRTVQAWAEPWIGNDLFFTVEQVKFSLPVDGAVLANLARFPKLKGLILHDATRIGGGWWYLQELEQLETLELTGPGTDNTALVAVSQIRSLTTLELFGIKATDAGFAALATLPALRHLDLRFCDNLTAAGMAQILAGVPALRTLAVGDMGHYKGDALFAALPEQHPDLEALNLSHAALPRADRVAIGRLPRLKSLSLANPIIDDAGLADLQPLAALEELELDTVAVTDAGLPSLARLPALRSLRLDGLEVTDAGLAALERLPLTKLTLVGLPAVTDAGMASIGRIKSLTSLTIREMPGLTDAGLVPIQNLTGLKDCQILDTPVTPAGVAALQRTLPATTVLSPVPSVPFPALTPSPTPVSQP